MLAFLAIFGALGAGLLADTFLSARGGADVSEDEDDLEETESAEDEDDEQAGRSLFDWASIADESDDDEAEVEAPRAVNRFADLFARDFENVDDGMPVSNDLPDPVDPSETLTGGSGHDILSGQDGGDDLSGDSGNDQLTGRGGNDRLRGEDGDDILVGEDGDDQIFGGDGDDSGEGGAGNDLLRGEDGDDSLAGHAQDDVLFGGHGADTLHGGEGQDQVDGGSGDDWLTGGSGDDLLSGGTGQDTLDGGTGDDTLIGTADGQDDTDIDMLNGGDGDDVLTLGAGDWGSGGAGADRFELTDISADAAPAHITDFMTGEDNLVILFDPAMHPDPVLTISFAEGSDAATVLLDGVALAVVDNASGLTADMISLRPN